MSACYICKKDSAKRCTGCLLLSYCSVECQTKDWKYHRQSCQSKSSNVLDSLINAKTFDLIVMQILHYLGGKDLHAVRCTKRSWRDTVLTMWGSKADKKILEKRLEHQWSCGKSRARTVHEGEGQVERIVVNGEDLFLGVWGIDKLLVFDITKEYKMKHKIAKAEKRDVWSVHTDFILVYNGNRICCWDRKSLNEVEVTEDIQIGHHCKNLKDRGLKWRSKSVKKENDEPVAITMFDNRGIIVYKSGLILKFDIQSPSMSYECNTFTEISIEVLESFDSLMVLSPMSSLKIFFSHGESGSRHYWDGLTTAYVKDGNTALFWNLEYGQEEYTIEGVDKILDVFQDDCSWGGTSSHVLVSRIRDYMSDGEYDEEESSDEEEDDTQYLQLWSTCDVECLRTMKIIGLTGGKLNSNYMAVATCHYFKRKITLWNMKELTDENITTSKITPVCFISMKDIPMCMVLRKDRFIWSEDVEDLNEIDYYEDEFVVKECNFWYC